MSTHCVRYLLTFPILVLYVTISDKYQLILTIVDYNILSSNDVYYSVILVIIFNKIVISHSTYNNNINKHLISENVKFILKTIIYLKKLKDIKVKRQFNLIKFFLKA